MSTATDLAALGWRTNTSTRLRQAIRDFQAMWNLGTALTVDGNDGPKTRAALAESMARKAKGMPDISASFSAVEFQCNCGDGGRTIASDCRRIWAPRSTVQMAEKFRTLAGPFTPERACRCPRENTRVGGAKSSQHLSGRGLDVPVTTVTVTAARKALGTVGIGTYSGNGRLYVRHIDNRGSWAQWNYGALKTTPIAPRPDLAVAPKPSGGATSAPTTTNPTPTPSKEDDIMASTVKNPLTGEQWTADDALWSIWTYAINAARDAAVARKLAEAQAKVNRPLTATETAQATRDAIAAIAQEAQVAEHAVEGSKESQA